MEFWQGKRVVVGIGGGIAACKSLELLRRLHTGGARLEVVLTAAGLRFVTPLAAQALSGGPVHHDLFDLEQERQMGHIRLAREAELVVVAPATADLMAKLAGGHADDLLTALLLARRGPVLLAPAMNSAMWSHPATRRNLAQLRADGLHLVGPESGPLACGETGVGRLAEVEEILETARRLLTPTPLAGHRILVTAGPTREELDPVRYLGNHSSGRMGFAVALAALRAGARVTLIHGPVEVSLPPGADAVAVTSAAQMQQAVLEHWPHCRAGVFAAAVADYHPRQRHPLKTKKGSQGESWLLELEQTADILAQVVARRQPGQVVLGFAAETGDAVAKGREKLARKGCDLLAVNDVSEAGSGFQVATNRLTLLDREGGLEEWPLMSKEAAGERLVAALARRLGPPPPGAEP